MTFSDGQSYDLFEECVLVGQESIQKVYGPTKVPGVQMTEVEEISLILTW